MGHASIIYGHMFNRRELLRATDLQPLTVERLESYLKEKTFLLDLELEQLGGCGRDLDLRTGKYTSNPTRVPVSKMSGIALLVGTCLADLSIDGGEYLNLSALRCSDIKFGKSKVIDDFNFAFPKKLWEEKHFQPYLVSAHNDRFARNKRMDYDILTIKN